MRQAYYTDHAPGITAVYRFAVLPVTAGSVRPTGNGSGRLRL